MTVYYELDHDMKLPLVPIVQNCAVPPLMPVRRAYEFGKALGDAIRSYDGLQRVAVVGAGGLSHWIGKPRVGDIDEDFDRWFLERLERGELDQVLDMPDSEIELAGNGAHEIRSWLAVAGAVAPTPGRRRWPTSRSTRGSPAWPSAQWETLNGSASATAGERSDREEESDEPAAPQMSRQMSRQTSKSSRARHVNERVA